MGIIVDLFAGGGGASQGIFEALGRHPDAAVNHSPQAIAIHAANHPDTEHWCQDVWSVDPSWVSRGRPVDLLWASPDCTHHSKAKGGAPKRDEKRRDLAMVISHKWVPALKPRVLILENVEEFKDWGPCNSQGIPVACAKGENFRAFVNSLRRHGYAVQWRELVACDYGAPTTRKRLFLIARCDKRPIVWPEPTHGAPDSPEVLSGKMKPWRTATEIIDWSLPCPSIFATSQEIWEQYGLRSVRPLAENTLRRISKGIQRYVLDSAKPFIVNLAHTKKDGTYDCFRGCSINDPLPTITQSPGVGIVTPFVSKLRGSNVGYPASEPVQTVSAGGTHHALTMPFLQHVQHSMAKNGTMPADEPLRTVTAQPKGGGIAMVAPLLVRDFGCSVGAPCTAPAPTVMATGQGKSALVAPVLTSYYGPKGKNDNRSRPLDGQLPTQTTENRFSIVMAHIMAMYGTSTGLACDVPLHTVMGHDKFALVSSFFVKYYGCGDGSPVDAPLHTATTKDRFALVTVTIDGEVYAIVDIGMRMLVPLELLLAQGFPVTYIIDEIDGKKVPKNAQVAMIGNSVCPPLARALVAANYVETRPEEIEARRQKMPLIHYARMNSVSAGMHVGV